MIYTVSITTPKNTLVTAPRRTVLTVTKGLVFRFDVQFPPGPCGLVYVAVFDGNYQVWPSTPGQWFISDDMVIGYDDLYFKNAAPFEFTIYTVNLDDTYDHWCQIRIALVTKEVYMARFIPSLAWKEYAELLTRIESEQAARREELIVSPFPWIGAREEE